MRDKLALVADQDTVLGFGFLGMECYEASSHEESIEAFANINPEDFAVIFITDEVAEYLGEDLDTLKKKMLLIRIPSCLSRKSMDLKEIQNIVEKAVGIANIMDKA